MLPSRVMIAAEQQRCETIVIEEWKKLTKEYNQAGLSKSPAPIVVARILNRIRRVE
jgi:hypothetical protein